KNAPADLKAAAFADTSQVKVGDPVMAIGNPLGLSDTVTTGIVSALNRPVTTQQESQNQDPFGLGQQAQGETVVTNAIQTDASVKVDDATRQAAIINAVTGGQAAANGGVKEGDAVIALNGASLDGADSLVARIRALQPGTKVTMTVVRDGKKMDLQVTLGTK